VGAVAGQAHRRHHHCMTGELYANGAVHGAGAAADGVKGVVDDADGGTRDRRHRAQAVGGDGLVAGREGDGRSGACGPAAGPATRSRGRTAKNVVAAAAVGVVGTVREAVDDEDGGEESGGAAGARAAAAAACGARGGAVVGVAAAVAAVARVEGAVGVGGAGAAAGAYDERKVIRERRLVVDSGATANVRGAAAAATNVRARIQ